MDGLQSRPSHRSRHMIQQNAPYGLSTTIVADFVTAVSRAKAALAAEGFGALAEMTDIGLLLPCNVIVYATDDDNRTVIAALDPVAALSLTGNDAIRSLAEQVKHRLHRPLDAVDPP